MNRYRRSRQCPCPISLPGNSSYRPSTRQKRPICIDLFAGAGGLSLGFESAGFDVAAAVDIDPIHCATHAFNFPYCATLCRDVVHLDGARIRVAADIGDAEVAVVVGGAPCQGFSVIGKRALDDPRNALLLHFVRLVHELRPAHFAFENVRGLTIGEQRQALNEMIEAFAPEYRVLLPYQILNAADFGVPQDRHRLFLLGARSDQPLPQYPDPNPLRVTVSAALSDLPDVEMIEELQHRDWTRATFGPPSPYARKLRTLATDTSDFGHRRQFDAALMTASLRTAHSATTRLRFETTRPGKREPVSRLHRLDPEAQSNTIRAGTGSDRGAFTSPRPIHPAYPRVITNREAARLHSFPDWFRFHVTKWHGFRQIGNSVPPLLARAVAAQIARAIGHTPSAPRRPLSLGNPTLLELSMTEAARGYDLSADALPKRRRTPRLTLPEAPTSSA